MDPEELAGADPMALLSHFSVSSLIANLVFSAIGLWLFREARRRNHVQVVMISILMMVYSYFTPNAWWDWIIGIGLCVWVKVIWQ